MDITPLKIKNTDYFKWSSKIRRPLSFDGISSNEGVYKWHYYNLEDLKVDLADYSSLLTEIQSSLTKFKIHQEKTFDYRILKDLFFEDSVLTTSPADDSYVTKPKRIDKTDKEEIRKKSPAFQDYLNGSDIQKLDEWILQCYEDNADLAKQLIQNQYYSLLTEEELNEKAIVNLIRVFQNFDFEEMLPIGPIILVSALNCKADKVKSAVLDVIGHWPNEKMYNILKKLDPPSGFLYRAKFESLLESFKKRYDVPKKD